VPDPVGVQPVQLPANVADDRGGSGAGRCPVDRRKICRDDHVVPLELERLLETDGPPPRELFVDAALGQVAPPLEGKQEFQDELGAASRRPADGKIREAAVMRPGAPLSCVCGGKTTMNPGAIARQAAADRAELEMERARAVRLENRVRDLGAQLVRAGALQSRANAYREDLERERETNGELRVEVDRLREDLEQARAIVSGLRSLVEEVERENRASGVAAWRVSTGLSGAQSGSWRHDTSQ
jgi:hypothetical protein